ncbi:MAG: putative tail-component [Bacteriophage sp.]|nr:MAG: putative tail-component [Bacteriophage sp.]
MTYRLQLSADWARKLSTQQLNKGGVKMMTDILKMARQNAPVLTGALRNSGRFQQLSTVKWRITFGNSRVPYARIREHANRLHPNTVRYLQRARNTAASRAKSYFNLG